MQGGRLMIWLTIACLAVAVAALLFGDNLLGPRQSSESAQPVSGADAAADPPPTVSSAQPDGARIDPVTAGLVTGIFGSDFGPVVLAAGGGRYPHSNGRLDATYLSGNAMAGNWEQPPSTVQACSDGRYWGRFRFEFDEAGFSGRYSRCGGEMTLIWRGWRPRPVQFHNNCPHRIDLYLRWTDQEGVWRANGPWTINSFDDLVLTEERAAGRAPIRATSIRVFAYVLNTATRAVIFEGNERFRVGGVPYPMGQTVLEVGDPMRLSLGCENLVVSARKLDPAGGG